MRRVLVVDDDRQMVRTLCDILTLKGWAAEGAHSGEDAVVAVREREYTAVLMDVRMGGINGVEALREMRAARPELPVILMTAYTANDLLAEAEREGAVRVFAKPVALDQLIPILESLLSGSRRVLVVDDNPQFLTTVADLLRSRGFVVIAAETLERAIAALEEKSPGVVLLDLRLDGLDPRDAVLAIHRVSPAVALVLFSGHPATLAETTAALPPSWIRGTLQKPFPPDRLITLLDAIFGH